LPKSRLDFWGPKIQRNRDRDAESVKMLKSQGWRVLTIWQCQTKDTARLKSRLMRFFFPTRGRSVRLHPRH
jgi:DNA mismatch endonuclease (patch repair protein)